MKLKDIINQLANRINQPHVIEVYKDSHLKTPKSLV